jgi:hypothetical protein
VPWTFFVFFVSSWFKYLSQAGTTNSVYRYSPCKTKAAQ